jgi:drug/metabolite transporter (DMT)-like permease
MSNHLAAVLVTIGFRLVGVVGDYFLKLASQADVPIRTKWFYVGFAVYASTAFGWVFVMKHLKLATVGVVYSVSMIVFLTLVGALMFGESLSGREVAGVALAIVSLYLLIRFA